MMSVLRLQAEKKVHMYFRMVSRKALHLELNALIQASIRRLRGIERC